MGTENHLNPRRQRGKSPDRGTVGCEISLAPVEPDGAGIVCVAVKSKPLAESNREIESGVWPGVAMIFSDPL